LVSQGLGRRSRVQELLIGGMRKEPACPRPRRYVYARFSLGASGFARAIRFISFQGTRASSWAAS
jgi:hypothetical protein